MLTEPGELVLDPFVGTGTTTAVAHRLERRWIGIDNPQDGAAPGADGGKMDTTTPTNSKPGG